MIEWDSLINKITCADCFSGSGTTAVAQKVQFLF